MPKQSAKRHNHFKQHKVWTAVIGAVVLLTIVGTAIGRSSNTTTSSNSTNSANPGLVTTTAGLTLTAPPPSTSTVLLDRSGQGSQRTPSFTTSREWELAYTFDCSNLDGQGTFQFEVQNADGTASDDPGASDVALSGGATDDYHDIGQHYLAITSACKWHITVTE
jgi:hypothetical protein